MGGDDSQKLLPWRGIHSSPGRKPPAHLQNQHSSSKPICSGVVVPAPSSLRSVWVSELPIAQRIERAELASRMLSPVALE